MKSCTCACLFCEILDHLLVAETECAPAFRR